ncbi:MAG: 16S rRNA (guanine966-N2)-methyltransferase [Candidatus Midichloriaceae bacterium]|jgi:16S rRNA (guanine966-N2)-methyltransferase
MRIISGKYKNKEILGSTKGLNPILKPTTAKTRESVFNIIFDLLEKNNKTIQNCSFADMCCGTGAVGLEALSSGCSEVYFIDKQRESIQLTKHNIFKIHDKNPNQKISIINKDIVQIKKLPLFDIIYLDPPYEVRTIVQMINSMRFFAAPNSLLIVELKKRSEIEEIEGFKLLKIKYYKNCKMLFFTKL